jgi:signal transduction histidine kinase
LSGLDTPEQKRIDELFEYTKLSSHGLKLDFRKIELGSLLEQIIGEYISIFEREGLTIKKEIPQEDIEVDLDVEKIVRVFTNLLENARKYSTKPFFSRDEGIRILDTTFQ